MNQTSAVISSAKQIQFFYCSKFTFCSGFLSATTETLALHLKSTRVGWKFTFPPIFWLWTKALKLSTPQLFADLGSSILQHHRVVSGRRRSFCAHMKIASVPVTANRVGGWSTQLLKAGCPPQRHLASRIVLRAEENDESTDFGYIPSRGYPS